MSSFYYHYVFIYYFPILLLIIIIIMINTIQQHLHGIYMITWRTNVHVACGGLFSYFILLGPIFFVNIFDIIAVTVTIIVTSWIDIVVVLNIVIDLLTFPSPFQNLLRNPLLVVVVILLLRRLLYFRSNCAPGMNKDPTFSFLIFTKFYLNEKDWLRNFEFSKG